ncbi:MAG: hypothetical protein KDD25_00695 [Bdellovibrionales bacterium]|nr:hypothetical protein [Bdellovibrionales bacterium]
MRQHESSAGYTISLWSDSFKGITIENWELVLCFFGLGGILLFVLFKQKVAKKSEKEEPRFHAQVESKED